VVHVYTTCYCNMRFISITYCQAFWSKSNFFCKKVNKILRYESSSNEAQSKLIQTVRQLQLYAMRQEMLLPETCSSHIKRGASKVGIIKFKILGGSTESTQLYLIWLTSYIVYYYNDNHAHYITAFCIKLQDTTAFQFKNYQEVN